MVKTDLFLKLNKSARDIAFDNLKSIAIFLVVLGHFFEIINYPITQVLYKIIYTFHIPLFVFLSGYFAKFNFKKIFLKLILPYLIIQTIWAVATFFATNQTQDFFTLLFTPQWYMWYMFSLIVWRLSVPLLKKAKNFLPSIFTLAIAISLAIPLLNFDGYIFSFIRTLSFYPFFILGFYFSVNKINPSKIITNELYKIGVCVLFLAMIGGFFLLFPNAPAQVLYQSYTYSQLSNYDLITKLYIYAVGFVGVIFIVNSVGSKNTLLSKVGSKTLEIFLLHGVYLIILKKLLRTSVFHLPLTTSLIVAATDVLLCILIAFIGKKIIQPKTKIKSLG